MALAVQHTVGTIAFPAISCGIYGYSLKPAARIALGTTIAFLAMHLLPERIIFVCFEAEVYNAYQAVWQERWAD